MIANTVCLPLNTNYKNAWDHKRVTVAGWGYMDTLQEGEWYPDPDVKPGEGKYFNFYNDFTSGQ